MITEPPTFMGARRFILILPLALVLVAAARLPPLLDETYYWTWGRALAWSYVDHPPGIAFLLGASSSVLGDGLLGLRGPTLVSMVVVAWMSILGARRLVDPSLASRTDAIVALSLLGAPMFMVGYLPATPDPFQGAWIAVAGYAVIRALEPDAKPGWIFSAAFLLIGGALLKHSSLLIAAGAFVGLASSSARTLMWRSRALWSGAAMGALVLVPWVAADLEASGSFTFQASRVLHAPATRGPLAIVLVVGSMMGTLGPLAALYLFRTIGRAHRLSSMPARAVHASGAGVLIGACVVAVWLGSGEANWPMPAFVFALPTVAAQIAEGSDGWFKAYRAVALGATALVAVLLIHIAAPFLPFPPHKDRTLRAAGFAEIAAEVERLAERHQARAVVTRRYQMASMMRYHLRDRFPVVELGTARRSQFDRWARPTLCAGDVAIVIMPESTLPSELSWVPLAGGAQVKLPRMHGALHLDDYFVTPIRLERDDAHDDEACRGRALATRLKGATP